MTTRIPRAALVRCAPMVLVGALALGLTGCGRPQVPSAPPTARVAAMTSEPVPTPAPTTPTPSPTPRPTVSLGPTPTPLPFFPDLNADNQREIQIQTLNATCRDGDATKELIWTCSRDEVDFSVYGPSPPHISAIRVVTTASRETDRRSWLRGYASLIGVQQWQWAEDHFGSNDAAKVGDVWVQMTHDAKSDGVVISIERLALPTT